MNVREPSEAGSGDLSVFLSYRRRDSAGHAGRLYDTLRSRLGRSRIFMDIDTIEPGVDFVNAINEAVGRCDVMLALIGPEWLSLTSGNGTRRIDEPDDYVRIEIEAALARDVRLIPVLVGGGRMPSGRQLPLSIAALGRRNAIELSDARWAYDTGRLMELMGLEPSPPPSAAAVGPAAVRDLPAPVSPLIGRAEVLAELGRALETQRLVTITGPGGTGKTRLAIELGWTRDDPALDIWFLDLSAIRDSTLVPALIGARLGIADEGPLGAMARFQARLADRDALLILDNFEQVLDGAQFVSDLLAAARRLRVVATSRAPLRLRGERLFPLGPLGLPVAGAGPEVIARSPAVQLFVERARDTGAALQVDDTSGPVLVEICRRLDSLPLAIELAAARILELGLDGVAAGLARRLELLTEGPRDIADRQRSLRLAIDWSHDLIGPEEASLFRRVSVLSGGGSAEAAETICGEGLASLQALLDRLAAQSLLARTPGADALDRRVSQLETIRAYAAERLAESGEVESLRERHAEYFVTWAEWAEAELRGPSAATWLNRIRIDIENIRAAVEWAIEQDRPELGLRLVAALRSCLGDVGHLTEARDWLARLLALPGPRSDEIQASGLSAAGNLAWLQADFEAARSFHEGSLSLRLALGDPEPIAASLSNLATVAWQLGDYERARTLLEDSLARSQESGDTWGAAATLGNLADVAIFELDFEHAHTLYEEALTGFRALGDQASIARVLSNLGQLAIYRREHGPAATILEEARALATALRADGQVRTILLNQAQLATRLGDADQARRHLAESFDLSRAADDRFGIIECLERLGELVAREGGPAAAATIWGAAAAARRATGAAMYPVDRAWYDEAVAGVRAALGEVAFLDRWEAGEGQDPARVATDHLLRASEKATD